MEPIEERAGREQSLEPQAVPQPEPPAGSGVAAMRAVTISRLYGSGGGEIGAQLAHRMGWQLVDHEIVVQVAEQDAGCQRQDARAWAGLAIEADVVADLVTEALAALVGHAPGVIVPGNGAARRHR